ncbi:Fasciclin-like arabinogalactan protein [Fulvia fulva]|nr:Fasciclin-like arabinogalactan protein [Fulvia fulva]
MLLTSLASLGFVALTAAQDLISALHAQPDLSTLLGALQDVPEIAVVLAAASNITILAPTNDAFAQVPARSPLGTALANKEADAIAALLAYHVLSGTFMSTDFMEDPQYVSTLLVAYEVDGVSVTNVTGGQNVGLQLNGSDATILSGEMMSSVVTEADIQVGEIIVHKIDSLLTLPVKASAQASEAGLTGIVDALTQASLVETVDTTPDLTVFIPSNEAFAALGTGYEGLDTEALTDILTYHVIAGNVLFSPELSNTTVPSLQGTDLTVTVLGDAVFINEAQVIIPNIIIANGVAHVINQ